MKKNYSLFSKIYLVWLIIFAIIPLLMMIVLSFGDSEGVDFTQFAFTLNNFTQLFEKNTQIAFWNSIWISAVATFFCALFGYLVAYEISRSHLKNKYLFLIILLLPMWSNVLLRTEALGNIFQSENILADLLYKIGINYDVDIKGSYLAVIIGLVVTYLPIMVLPIYNTLEKIDPSLSEASFDLGLTRSQTFLKIILPLSAKGIVTGCIMVFLPCLSGFAIPEILGNGNIVMIGNIIDQLFRDMNYNVGSLLGVLILIFITGSIVLVSKFDKNGDTVI